MERRRVKGFLLLFFSLVIICVKAENIGTVDRELDEKAQNTHRIDSLNILLYTFLLILTVVTIWIFKYRRARYLHETGLAIIYGLIVGAILRYTGDNTSINIMRVIQDPNVPYKDSTLPDTLWLKFNKSTNSSARTYAYVFKGGVSRTGENEIVQKATFDPEIFFNILLPPIIFNAGYSLKRKHFFKNLGAIFAFAFLGTAITAFVVGGLVYGLMLLFHPTLLTFTECLIFGALISATDPVTTLAIFSDLHVDVNLYALVFGESVLNDAVAIVLSSTIESYGSDTGGFEVKAFFMSILRFLKIFSLSLLMGCVMGCLTAVLTKFTRLRDFPLLETALFVLMSYSTFLMAEAAELTGIVAVLFCGICQAHYTYNNLSTESRTSTKSLFELLNFLSENFIFSYIGVSMFTFDHHLWDGGLIATAFFAIIVGRLMNIYPLSCLLNLGRTPKIPTNFMHMLFFSGLRGAIAFALAIRNTNTDGRRAILSTTLLIVIVTVVLCGGMTTQVLSWLGIPVDVEDEETHHLNQFQPVRNGYKSIDETRGPSAGDSEGDGGEVGGIGPSSGGAKSDKAYLFRVWSRFDVKFMKPFLTNSRPTLLDTMPICCNPIARLLTTTEQLTREMDPLNDDMPLDESLLSAGPRTSIDSSRPNVTNPLYDGDLGLGSGSLVNTKVSIPGAPGHNL